MLALSNHPPSNALPETNFREKIRCGEVYRNLNGNEMFQKFYYRCLECSMDFESSPEFEEHVIVHYLQEDEDCAIVDSTGKRNTKENVIDISSEDDEDNDYLYAVEVASLVEGNVSENDLPLPLMQMLSEASADSSDQIINCESDEDDEDEKNVAFPCDGLRRQALHQYSEPEKCCTRCPAYFNTKSDLNFHLHIHTLPNTVMCPHCYEVYANTNQLNEHLRVRRKKPRKNTKTNNVAVDDDDENFNSQVRKKVKNNQCAAVTVTVSNQMSQSQMASNETINIISPKTDANAKCQQNNINVKENLNSDGKNTINNINNCPANAKRKDGENHEKGSTTTNNSSTTLLEINQTDKSNSANTVKDI